MAYATVAQLKLQLGATGDSGAPGPYDRLTDRVKARSANDTLAGMVLDQAAGVIDSWLGLRYRVPIDVTGEPARENVLRTYTLHIAEHMLYDQHPLIAQAQEPDGTKRHFDEAMEWLKRVANGDESLPGLEPPVEAESAGFSGQAVGNPAILTQDAMEGLG